MYDGGVGEFEREGGGEGNSHFIRQLFNAYPPSYPQSLVFI